MRGSKWKFKYTEGVYVCQGQAQNLEDWKKLFLGFLISFSENFFSQFKLAKIFFFLWKTISFQSFFYCSIFWNYFFLLIFTEKSLFSLRIFQACSLFMTNFCFLHNLLAEVLRKKRFAWKAFDCKTSEKAFRNLESSKSIKCLQKPY